MTYVEIIRGGDTVSKDYQEESQLGYGSVGKAGRSATPELFHTLVRDIVLPKVVPTDGNKVTKVSTTAIDGFDCYYTTINDTIIVCFATVETPKILPLRILTDLKPLNNENNDQLHSNIEDITKQFHQELLSYHDSSTTEATETDLQQIIDIMNDNIDKFLQRQERISLLVDKTSQLNNSSYNFKRKAVKIKRKLWWKNFKLCSTIVFVVITLIIIGILILHSA